MVKASSAPSDASVTFRAGDSLFSEGEPGNHLFVIERGSVELLRASGERATLLERGDLLGESSLLEGTTRECSARALTEVEALRLDRAALDALVASPDVALLLLRRLSLRLREARQGAPAPPAARPAAPRAGKLVHEATGREFVLPAERRVVVGRPSKGQAPDVDLSPVDTERSLSRRHAALWQEGGQHFVCEEKGVSNGTFVNGHRLTAGEPVALSDGDKIVFGLVKTIFRLV